MMEKMKKKISVIVPVYNVEKYLVKCVDSIKNQSYKNLEIILVDDGSSDSCPRLCDDLRATDNRIEVIHKKNGGLSDARNAGLDIASGDYIGFVDSDDFIDMDFFELLVNNLEEYSADVSCCRYKMFWENGKTEPIGGDGKISIFKDTDALKEYLYGKNLDPFACCKLFKSEIINNTRFINGIVGEDNPFCIEVFKNTKTVVLAGECKYNYLQARKGAITNNKISEKKLDSIYYWDKVRLDCKENYPELEKYALRRQVLFYIGLYNTVYNDKDYKCEADKARAFVKEHLKEIKESDICERVVKFSAKTLSFSPAVYRVFMKIYKKVIGRARL